MPGPTERMGIVAEPQAHSGGVAWRRETPRVPQQGRSLHAEPEKGKVTITVPGSAPATVTEGASVPVGSVVDARAGSIRPIGASDSRGTAQYLSRAPKPR